MINHFKIMNTIESIIDNELLNVEFDLINATYNRSSVSGSIFYEHEEFIFEADVLGTFNWLMERYEVDEMLNAKISFNEETIDLTNKQHEKLEKSIRISS